MVRPSTGAGCLLGITSVVVPSTYPSQDIVTPFPRDMGVYGIVSHQVVHPDECDQLQSVLLVYTRYDMWDHCF